MEVESFWILVVHIPVLHTGAGLGAGDFSGLSMEKENGGSVGM